MDNYYIHEICRSRKIKGVFAKVGAGVIVGVSAAVVVFSGLFAGVFVEVFKGENT